MLQSYAVATEYMQSIFFNQPCCYGRKKNFMPISILSHHKEKMICLYSFETNLDQSSLLLF